MPAEFQMTRRVQFAETDLAGVLYFANYYRYMEEVEHAFWRSVGCSVITKMDGREVSWPRVKTSMEYFAPARFEDELGLLLSITNVSDRSMSLEVDFRRGDEKIAVGKTKAVCCSMIDGRFSSIAIPPPLRAALEGEKEAAS